MNVWQTDICISVLNLQSYYSCNSTQVRKLLNWAFNVGNPPVNSEDTNYTTNYIRNQLFNKQTKFIQNRCKRSFTHKSINFSRTDMFDGIGPSSPLPHISLYWHIKFNTLQKRRIKQKSIKMEKILQSGKKVPALYKFRYWTTKIVVIDSTACSNRTVVTWQ